MKRIFAAVMALVLCLTIFTPALAEEAGITVRTPLAGSGYAKIRNVELAASHLNGITVPGGAKFSFNDIVGPRTTAYGYQAALNGRGAKVTGGGVAQCATTLYLALEEMGADIEYRDLNKYGSSFADDYVSRGSDAVMVDYSSGSDFSFVNYGDDLLIEMWTTDSYLYCSLTIAPLQYGDNFLTWNPNVNIARVPISSASIHLTGDDSQRSNILLAASSINDTVLSPGDLFSFNDSVGPRSSRYGYVNAVNGRGAEVTGGGVAQVASVIWLAVKNMDEVSIVAKSTYGSRYNQDYVASSNDAILTDYSGGTDFSFRNAGDAPLTIATYITGDLLKCEIYRN